MQVSTTGLDILSKLKVLYFSVLASQVLTYLIRVLLDASVWPASQRSAGLGPTLESTPDALHYDHCRTSVVQGSKAHADISLEVSETQKATVGRGWPTIFSRLTTSLKKQAHSARIDCVFKFLQPPKPAVSDEN